MSNMDTTSTCDYSDPYSESFHPFLLFRIVLIKSAPAYAKHCNCQRKALQLPTQSFASAHAKLCICSRKALHDIVSPILNEKREERLSISGTVVPQGNYCRLVLPDYNYLRQRRLISSRVLPLVSGTMRQTKRAARMQMAP